MFSRSIFSSSAKEEPFHSAPNAGSGRGAKKLTGRPPANIECIPPTGSHTLIACQVSPWYPPRDVANLFFSGRPRLCQYCRAIFMATSTETDPESQKNTFCNFGGVISIKRLASVTAGSWVSPPNITWLIFSSCPLTASFMCGLLYPCATAHHDDIPSMSSEPSAIFSLTPRADSTSRDGSGFFIEA